MYSNLKILLENSLADMIEVCISTLIILDKDTHKSLWHNFTVIQANQFFDSLPRFFFFFFLELVSRQHQVSQLNVSEQHVHEKIKEKKEK